MAKRPQPGQTKTRLCPPLAPEQAAALYEGFLCDTLDLVWQVAGVRPAIAYTPEDARGYFAQLAPDTVLLLQQGVGLGERLAAVTTDALAAGAPALAAISSDSPTIPLSYLERAFNLLAEGADLVLGPADDGGYYLVGLRRPAPQLFLDVVMSTPSVLHDTLEVAAQLGLRTVLLPTWYDVDTIEDLDRLRADSAPLRYTRPILDKLPGR